MIESDRDFYVQRTYTLPRISKLNEEIVQQLDNVFDYASPAEYRNSLIEIYHAYIRHEHGSLPKCFDEIAIQMCFLTDFLMTAYREMNTPEKDRLVDNTNTITHTKTDSEKKDLILLLAGEELKSYKFFSVLRSVGLDDAFYQTNLVNFLLHQLNLDQESNLVLDTYFQLLDEHSKDMKATNESVQECALSFYEAITKFRNEIKHVRANG